jgi:hypothetical protein
MVWYQSLESSISTYSLKPSHVYIFGVPQHFPLYTALPNYTTTLKSTGVEIMKSVLTLLALAAACVLPAKSQSNITDYSITFIPPDGALITYVCLPIVTNVQTLISPTVRCYPCHSQRITRQYNTRQFPGCMVWCWAVRFPSLSWTHY